MFIMECLMELYSLFVLVYQYKFKTSGYLPVSILVYISSVVHMT